MHRIRRVVVLAALASFASLGLAQSPAPLVAKGQAALDAGRAGEALRQGVAVVAKYPKLYEGHRLVARASLLLDQPDRAESAFRQALRLAPLAARPALQYGLREAAILRQALRLDRQARTLKASGDLAAAALAEAGAYRALPSRDAFGIAAAELFESAGRLDDARRLLEDVRARRPSANAATHVPQRLAALRLRIDAARQQAAETAARKQADERRAEADRQAEDARRAAETARRAKEDARERADAERQAEEAREKAEKLRLDREETDRLAGILNDQKSAANEAENAVRKAEGSVDDAERDVRKADGEADDARDRRDRAKREKDAAEDKLKDATGDLSRQLAREGLRNAENKYDDAKDRFERTDHRLDEAKSRLAQTKADADAARKKLERSRQDVRETEDAIAKIANGG